MKMGDSLTSNTALDLPEFVVFMQISMHLIEIFILEVTTDQPISDRIRH